MRLIDEAYLQMHKVHGTIGNIKGDFVSGVTIAHAPTIDAEPVRHGRIIEFWEDAYHPRRKFSCCGTDCTKLTQWIWPKYCPYCGAKLDEEIEEENDEL